MMVIDNIFNIGDIVYLKTDCDQKQRIVTAIMVFPGMIKYLVASGTEDKYFFEIEISATKDVLITTTG